VNWLLALATAVLLVLCFPPYGAVWLAPLALAPLLIACARERRGAWRFALGYAAGVVYWAGVCPWIHFTLVAHGGVGEAGGWALFVLFCLFKALQMGAFAWLAGYYAGSYIDSRWAAPCIAGLWTVLEFTHAPLWFAWLHLGNAAIDLPLPLRLAPITGVWGISFLFALSSTAAALAILRRPRQLAWLALWPALFLLPPLPAPAPGTHTAIMVQPNVGEDEQFTERSYLKLRERLAGLSLAPALEHSAELVVWPEIPAPLVEDDPRFVGLERDVTGAGHVWLLTGIIGRARGDDVFNSAALFSPDGREVSRYDKVHLVPFGEFVPWPFGALAHKVSSEVSDFVPGERIVVSRINGHGLSAFICYESVFPGFIRDSVASGAEVLVNPSNDGWFGKTAARFQHVEIVRMRAAENARWILRGTNDGITAAIDPAGRMAQSVAGYTEITARMGFDYRSAQTLYTRWGDWFQWICLTLAMLPWATHLRLPKGLQTGAA
jgi:apolipoprotein N-acyltransferase